MSFAITHVSGEMQRDPPLSAIAVLVEELEASDAEHPDVAVTSDGGWTLSAWADGRVVWENIEEDGEPRHLEGVGRDRLVRLLETLAMGDLATVEAESWISGY
jgi:hypothetical protein